MTYASQTDLEERFGVNEVLQLSDRENTGSIVVAVVTRARADADAEIDTYLASRYALPLSSVPAVLVRVAADMARYYLHDNRATEEVKARYDAAIRWLKSISSGAATLGLDTAADVVAPTTGRVQIDAPDRVFSQGKLSDYG